MRCGSSMDWHPVKLGLVVLLGYLATVALYIFLFFASGG